MSTFRYKAPKTYDLNKNGTTLDIEHNSQVEKFINFRESLPTKKKEIMKYNDELSKLEQKPLSKHTQSDIRRKSVLKDKINSLSNDIYNIENYVDEMEYYANTRDILNEYFKDTDNESSSISATADNIMDFFTKDNIKNTNISTKKINPKNNKASLLDNYKTTINDCYRSSRQKYSFIKYCNNCKSEKILNQTNGSFECINCGEIDLVIIESDRPNYKDPIPDNLTSAYKRINHQLFRWLKVFI